jgi:hypothetical protein
MSDIEEAETWLATAKLGFGLEGAPRARYTVVVAQCIHALIKGNDALSVRYLGRRSTRHEDAALLFGELVRQRKIPTTYAGLRALLLRAVSEKSEYDYKGVPVGRDTAARWLRETERFLAAVRQILG